jgi:uncharacterized membrane-anchored protein YhcB (DUF1043 family)
MTDILFLILGFAIGCMVMLNHKVYKEQKTVDEVEEELRKQLDFYKNTAESQKIDIDHYRMDAKRWQSKYLALEAQSPRE